MRACVAMCIQELVVQLFLGVWVGVEQIERGGHALDAGIAPANVPLRKTDEIRGIPVLHNGHASFIVAGREKLVLIIVIGIHTGEFFAAGYPGAHIS